MRNEDRHAPTMQSSSDLTLVSLFSGAGGLDLGFERAGFNTIWCNDILKDACDTHRSWSDAETVCADVKTIDPKSIPKANVIAGGFPCQGFSLAGPRKVDDSRNILYKFFVRAVDELQPEAFIAENVKGILTLGNGGIIRAIIDEFADKGYNVTANLVNAAEYGVPQDRMRVIIVGIRQDIGGSFALPEKVEKKTTLRDALADFGDPDPQDVCLAPYSSRYMSRNRKRGWDQQSYTIPAMAKQVALHPSSPDMVKLDKDLWRFGVGETRRFSWREVAAIQTFPKEIEFAGNLTSKYLQIGNAVPVDLAHAMAEAMRVQVFE